MSFPLKNTFCHSLTLDECIYDIYVKNNIVTYASSSPDIKLLTLPTLNYKSTLKGHRGSVRQMCFSQDGQFVVSVSEDETVRLWDLRTNQNIATRNGGIGELFGLDVCNNVYAISGREDIIVGDIRKFSQTLKKFSDGHSDEIREVKFKDQNTLLSSANDGLINTYDLKCQNVDESLIESLNVEQGINKFGFCGANGQYIYTVTQVEELYIWDIETNKRLASVSRQNLKSNYLIDAKYDIVQQCLFCFSGNNQGEILMTKVTLQNNGLQCQPMLTLNGGHKTRISAIWLGSNVILSGCEDARLCLWTSQQTNSKANGKIKSKPKVKQYSPYSRDKK